MLNFFKGKKVFVTGHTGFKGSWICRILINAGAEVSGYALEPDEKINLFSLSDNENNMESNIGDIRDFGNLLSTFEQFNPEIVFHLAAQPLVRESYQKPRYTYETNVMGTVNLLECIRRTGNVRSIVNITTDKVYKNNEWLWGYREVDELNGYDPYSNSKSCSELITSSYQKSFFSEGGINISTARAGNVIGGGDFAKDRIIPDCVKASLERKEIIVRNPHSIRPYQHVLEPLFAYLLIAEKQFDDSQYSGAYNIGPDESDCVKTGELVDIFCQKWEEIVGVEQSWVNRCKNGPHEANFLKLDSSKFKTVFKRKSIWHIEKAIEKTIEWVKNYHYQIEKNSEFMNKQINEYAGEYECLKI